MKKTLYSLNSTYNLCVLKNLQFRFQEKIWTWTGIRTSDLHTTSQAILPIDLSKFLFQFMFKYLLFNELYLIFLEGGEDETPSSTSADRGCKQV